MREPEGDPPYQLVRGTRLMVKDLKENEISDGEKMLNSTKLGVVASFHCFHWNSFVKRRNWIKISRKCYLRVKLNQLKKTILVVRVTVRVAIITRITPRIRSNRSNLQVQSLTPNSMSIMTIMAKTTTTPITNQHQTLMNIESSNMHSHLCQTTE